MRTMNLTGKPILELPEGNGDDPSAQSDKDTPKQNTPEKNAS